MLQMQCSSRAVSTDSSGTAVVCNPMLIILIGCMPVSLQSVAALAADWHDDTGIFSSDLCQVCFAKRHLPEHSSKLFPYSSR